MVLTREAGKNNQLEKRLVELGIEARSGCRIKQELHSKSSLSCQLRHSRLTARSAPPSQCLEMPLIEHGPAPDRPKLPASLRESWDWVIVTSPEAAAVLLEASRPQLPRPSPAPRDASRDPQATRAPPLAAGVEGGGLPPRPNRLRRPGHLPCPRGRRAPPALHPEQGQRRDARRRALGPAPTPPLPPPSPSLHR